MSELRDYLTEREMEILMAAPRRDRDLTNHRPKRLSRTSLLAQMKGAPPPVKTAPEPSELESAPHDPSLMSDREFLIFVSDEAKGDILTHESKALRAPSLLERWFWALGQLVDWVNRELRERHKKRSVDYAYHRWRESAVKYKRALEVRRAEIKPAVHRIGQERHENRQWAKKEYREMLEEVSAWLMSEEPFVCSHCPERDALKERIDDLLARHEKPAEVRAS